MTSGTGKEPLFPPDSWFADSPLLLLKLRGESVVIAAVMREASCFSKQQRGKEDKKMGQEEATGNVNRFKKVQLT